MGAAYQAARRACRLAWAVRGYREPISPAARGVASLTCSFTGENGAVPARAARRHRRACRAGRTGPGRAAVGIATSRKVGLLAGRRVDRDAEEVCTELRPAPGGRPSTGLRPRPRLSRPGGAHPSSTRRLLDRDTLCYRSLGTRSAGSTGVRRVVCSATCWARWTWPSTMEPRGVSDADAGLDRSTSPWPWPLRGGGATARSASFGVGVPGRAANLARATHAPACVLDLTRSGTIGAQPRHLPLSIEDGRRRRLPSAVVSVPEIFGSGCRPDDRCRLPGAARSTGPET